MQRLFQISSYTIKTEYTLIDENVKISNTFNEAFSDGDKHRKFELAAQHFATLTKKAIRSANNKSDMPNIVKTSFIKAKKDDMKDFLSEINNLFEKYCDKEDNSEEETYSLMTILAPFDVKEL